MSVCYNIGLAMSRTLALGPDEMTKHFLLVHVWMLILCAEDVHHSLLPSDIYSMKKALLCKKDLTKVTQISLLNPVYNLNPAPLFIWVP